VASAAAELTVIAVHNGFKQDARTRSNSRDSLAGGYDLTRRLVAQHDRIEDLHIPDHAVLIVMKVRPANTNIADTHLNLARTGSRNGTLDHSKLALVEKFSDLHAIF
jgi:hypothetical protein